MKILVVQDAHWLKKGPHQQHHLMEKLSIKGHEIIVIGFDQLWRSEKKGLFSKREVFQNVCRIYKGANGTFICPSFIRFPILDYISFLFSSRKEINRCINSFNPDIIIGFTSVISCYWGMKLAKKSDIPFLYYWTDVIHTLIPSKIFWPLAKLVEKKIIKNSAMVMAINENLRDYIVSFATDLSLTKVIPGGVDFQRFDPLKIDPLPVRQKYGISKDNLVLFFMGWIYPFSGLKEVISDIPKIKVKYPNIKLMIVGDGDYYPQLKKIIKDNDVLDHVILTGRRPFEEIPQLIAVADVCLLPAYNNEIMRDIVPIKMYEYLAMHKPVISTKLPGVMREFKDVNGVIYVDKPEDVINKATQLSKLDIQRIGLMAKRFIKKYDWDTIVSQFEDLLESLVKREEINNKG